MFRITAILLIAFFSLVNASAQLSINREISWESDPVMKIDLSEDPDNPIYIYYFNFQSANYPDVSTHLPYYFERFQMDAGYSKGDVELTNLVFKKIQSDNLSKVNYLDSIDTEIKPDVHIATERNVDYLLVSFIPIRRNPLTDELEELVSFSIKPVFSGFKSATLQKKAAYVNNSILATGYWYKIRVKEDGIYKLTYSELIGMGIQNPGNLRVYGDCGGQLPFPNSIPRPDDLQENAIYFETGNDGVFNEGDYVLFYGQGSVRWTYNTANKVFLRKPHYYSDVSYYFLTSDLGKGKTITSQSESTLPANRTTNSFDDYVLYEINGVNMMTSGKIWVSADFDMVTNDFDTSIVFNDIVPSDSLKVYYTAYARSTYTNPVYLRLYINDAQIDYVAPDEVPIYDIEEGPYSTKVTRNCTISSYSNETVNVRLNYGKDQYPSAKAWLDYLIVNARRYLYMPATCQFFRDHRITGLGNVTEFSVQNADDNMIVWNITDPYNIKKINGRLNGNNYSFKQNTDSIVQFVTINKSGNFSSPEKVGIVENQNLHNIINADYIVITHPDFKEIADSIAGLHRTLDQIQVVVIDINQIYNEFSSGAPDVVAIRDFIRFCYNKYNGNLKNVLLLGDGSYNNHGISPPNTNYILTYESNTSENFTQSFVTDDFYTFMDNNEGNDPFTYDLMDIGIGRIPVTSKEEAMTAYKKIKAYTDPLNFGSWRNLLCFVADDKDKPYDSFLKPANQLAEKVRNEHPAYIIDKIFLDAYQQVATSTGETYPEAHKAIQDNFTKGILLFNYTGHGSEGGITSERVLNYQDLIGLDNFPKLPIFVTATCEFSRFDNPGRVSSGEVAFLNPNGGGIVLFSTTRIVIGPENDHLNEHLFSYIFEKDSSGQKLTFGEVLRYTKNDVTGSVNRLKFVLLGDPALRSGYPFYNVITDSINGMVADIFTDTISAYSKLKISGHIADLDNNTLNSFNGVVYPLVLDKRREIFSQSNDGNGVDSFYLQNNIIYKGKATVNNGYFNFQFIVPKDIAYNIGTGKIIYYASNSFTDAHGFNEKLLIGGSSKNNVNDNIGPEITLFLNDKNFISGGITDESPILLAEIFDSSGINTVGSGIGHDITALLDKKTSSSYNLNDFYEGSENSYQAGQVKYKFQDLENGSHSLSLKIWDVANNSSEGTLDFVVAESAEIALSHVFNYPNPFTENTAFFFEHNQAFTNLDVVIQIFTVSGKLVKTIEQQINSEGFRPNEIPWDGLDDYGDKIGRGVYVYRIMIRNENGQVADKYEKLVILK